MTTYSKKAFGTLAIGVLFAMTSFVGVAIANAQFSLTGKNISFHAVVSAKSATTLTVLTSSTDPITLNINSKTKYPQGAPNPGDYVYIVARISNNTDVTALIVKKSQSGGPNDVYGTEGDNVVVRKQPMGPSTFPWLHLDSPTDHGTTIVFKVTKDTKYVGAKKFSDLKPGDILSVTGKDTNDNGFIAQVVIRHDGKDKKLEDNQENDD